MTRLDFSEWDRMETCPRCGASMKVQLGFEIQDTRYSHVILGYRCKSKTDRHLHRPNCKCSFKPLINLSPIYTKPKFEDEERYQRLLYWVLQERNGVDIPWNIQFGFDHLHGLAWPQQTLFKRPPELTPDDSGTLLLSKIRSLVWPSSLYEPAQVEELLTAGLINQKQADECIDYLVERRR